MSTDPYVDRVVRSWLEQGTTALPDRVLDTVLGRLPATPQRRAPWSARRFQVMNHSLKLAIAAAAVAVVAVAAIGFTVLPRPGSVGTPTGVTPTTPPPPTPTQSPSTPLPTSGSASASSTPAAGAAEIVRAWPTSRMEQNPAGRYSWDPDSRDWQGSTSGDGWMHSNRRGINVWFTLTDKGYRPGPIAATVGGYDATYQTLTPTADGAVKHVWMADMEGATVSITVEASAATSAADLAEAKAMVDSIRLERTASNTGFRLTFDLQTGWDSG